MAKLLIGLLLCMSAPAWADEIEFPDEELARETVLPVFSKRRIVLNRTVHTEKRFEFGAGAGLEMNEPFYNDFVLQAMATYNFDEINAFNLTGLFWMDGLSSYGEQLKRGGSFPQFDAMKAPHPKMAIFGNYEFIAYYGKISVTKQAVMNLNLFGIAGLGYMNLGDRNTVAMNFGLGQNLFLTKNFGLRFDLRWVVYQGPNPASRSLLPNAAAPSSFDNRIFFNSQLGVSGVFVL